MNIDVRIRPYSKHRGAYLRARTEFSLKNTNRKIDPRLNIQEFGKFIRAKVIYEWYQETNLLRVSRLEFYSEADYAWFLLRYSE
jgi:hypothetical protein